MRRAGAIAVLVLGLAPATARAASFEYLTSYVGIYGFSQHYKAAPGLPDGLDTAQGYVWAEYDYDKVTVHKDGTYTSAHTRFISANGDMDEVHVQGSDLPGGPFTTKAHCEISSSLKPVERSTSGSNVQGIPVSRNPAINLGWEIPDYGARPASDAPPFTVTGTGNPTCATRFASSFLEWTPSDPAATVLAPLAPTPAMSEAFGGTETIHYRDLPWKRDFKNVVIDGKGSRPGFTGPVATETAQVKVDASVEMMRVDPPPPPPPKPTKVDKIGALLLSEGFHTITTGGKPGGPPAGGGGGEETVLIPGWATATCRSTSAAASSRTGRPAPPAPPPPRRTCSRALGPGRGARPAPSRCGSSPPRPGRRSSGARTRP